jgi:polyhydroxyalkanoate synthesis regulator phasin
MFDLLKKSMLAGIGVTLMTKDKVEELARDLAASAQLSAEKGEEFVNEAVARAQKGRADLEDLVQRTVNDTLQRTPVATQKDVAALAERVAQLEQHHAE